MLEQQLEQKSFQDTVQETLKEFDKVASVNLSVGPYSTLGYDVLPPGVVSPPCVEVTQAFMDQIVSQSILTNALDQVFSQDGAADLKALLQNQQYKVNEGLNLPDIGSLIVLVIVIAIAGVLLKSNKDKNTGQKKIIAPLWAGILVTVVGALLAIVAIVVIVVILKKGWILGGIVLAGGLIVMVLGIIMIVRCQAQQKEFREKLLLAQTQAGAAPTVDLYGHAVKPGVQGTMLPGQKLAPPSKGVTAASAPLVAAAPIAYAPVALQTQQPLYVQSPSGYALPPPQPSYTFSPQQPFPQQQFVYAAPPQFVPGQGGVTLPTQAAR